MVIVKQAENANRSIEIFGLPGRANRLFLKITLTKINVRNISF